MIASFGGGSVKLQKLGPDPASGAKPVRNTETAGQLFCKGELLMKTPTVDDSKPKRDKLGPTGPAKVSGDDASKAEERNSSSAPTNEPSYESDLENILDRKRAQTPPG